MTALQDLLTRKVPLVAALKLLADEKAVIDEKEVERDRALAIRNDHLGSHKRAAAAALLNRIPIPEKPLALREAEVAYQAAEDAFDLLKPEGERLEAEAQPIRAELDQLGSQLEDQTWLDMDAATALLFAAAEHARWALRQSLARIQSVSRCAYEEAHRSRPGVEPRQTAAFRFWMRNEQRLGQVRALGSVQPDYQTGPELLRLVSEGKAQLGDISRWDPPPVVGSGTPQVNLPVPGQPEVQPAAPFLPNPATHPEEAWRAFNNPVWESPFMPRKLG